MLYVGVRPTQNSYEVSNRKYHQSEIIKQQVMLHYF